MRLLFTFQSTENSQYRYYANIIQDEDHSLNGKSSYFWFGDADEDKDGSPDWEHDGSGQASTRWLYEGKPINGNIIPFMVVPPQIIRMTPEIIGGCIGTAEYKDKIVPCVVGDSGPTSKIGELSSAALAGLGLPTTRNGNGGLDTQEILYRIWPGVAARLEVNGKVYQFVLQKC